MGDMEDSEINLMTGALALGALERPRLSLDSYYNQVEKIIFDLKQNLQKQDKGIEGQRQALIQTFVTNYHFVGNHDDYDDLKNANMIDVIDRRTGMPIALGILYAYIGEKAGLDIKGINFPGHFIVRLSFEGQRMLLDPFNEARILQAHDLRQFLKVAAGSHAELATHYYDDASKRDILLRLQNNIKYRLIQDEEYETALIHIEAMRLLAPQDYRLLFEMGILHSRIGNIELAINLLKHYGEKISDPQEQYELANILDELRTLL